MSGLETLATRNLVHGAARTRYARSASPKAAAQTSSEWCITATDTAGRGLTFEQVEDLIPTEALPQSPHTEPTGGTQTIRTDHATTRATSRTLPRPQSGTRECCRADRRSRSRRADLDTRRNVRYRSDWVCSVFELSRRCSETETVGSVR